MTDVREVYKLQRETEIAREAVGREIEDVLCFNGNDMGLAVDHPNVKAAERKRDALEAQLREAQAERLRCPPRPVKGRPPPQTAPESWMGCPSRSSRWAMQLSSRTRHGAGWSMMVSAVFPQAVGASSPGGNTR